MKTSDNLENRTPSEIYFKVQLVRKLVRKFMITVLQTTTTLEYNQDQKPLGVARILYSFRLILEQEAGKEIPKSGRLEFFKKFSSNHSDLLNDEENTSGPLNRGGIADLPLLRTLLAIG